MKRFIDVVKKVFVQGDTTTIRVLLALGSLGWTIGLWLPFGTFTRKPYAAMAAFASERVWGLLFLLQNGAVGQRYFIVDDQAVPSIEMVRTAAQALGVPMRTLALPRFLCELAVGPIICESLTCDFHLSNQRLKSLGFKLSFPDISTGIPDVVRRWQAASANPA